MLDITLKQLLDHGKCKDCIFREPCDIVEDYHFDRHFKSKSLCDYIQEMEDQTNED